MLQNRIHSLYKGFYKNSDENRKQIVFEKVLEGINVNIKYECSHFINKPNKDYWSILDSFDFTTEQLVTLYTNCTYYGNKDFLREKLKQRNFNLDNLIFT